MFYLIVQTVLLLAVAFILGAIIGCLLRRLVGSTVDATVGDEREGAVPVAAAAAVPAAAAARVPHRPQPRLVPQPLQPIDPDAPSGGPGAEPGVVPQPASTEATRRTVEGPGFGGAGGTGTGATLPPDANDTTADETSSPDANDTGSAAPSSDPKGSATGATAGGTRATRPRDTGRADDPAGDLAGAAGLVGATGVPGPGTGAEGSGDTQATEGRTDAEPRDAEPGDAGAADAPAFGLAGAAGVGAAGAGGGRDNRKLIRGIGPRNEGRLNEIGVFRFEQIAAWSRRQQREIGEELAFPGRIERERWVAQAKTLATGTTTEFSRRADAGRVRTSTGDAPAERGTKPPTLDAARNGKPDNLTLIDGVGNAIERKLFRLGIYHFDQVAAWSDDETVWVGDRIGFPGRAERENWREEARVLGEGGTTEHAKRVERGQIKTSRRSTDDEKG